MPLLLLLTDAAAVADVLIGGSELFGGRPCTYLATRIYLSPPRSSFVSVAHCTYAYLRRHDHSRFKTPKRTARGDGGDPAPEHPRRLPRRRRRSRFGKQDIILVGQEQRPPGGGRGGGEVTTLRGHRCVGREE